MTVYFYRTGSFYASVDSELNNLKKEVKESCGKHIRRVDRFIRLSLIGSFNCVQDYDLPAQTNLYLGSGEGPKTNITKALQEIFMHQLGLMPMSFINMVSNASSFNIAQTFELHGGNIFTSGPNFILDKVLKLASADLNDCTTESALVGCVDECAEPFDKQREKLNLDDDQPIGEGSYWFLLGNKPENAIASLMANKHFGNQALTKAWLEQTVSNASTKIDIAMGYGLEPEDKAYLQGLDCNIIDYCSSLSPHRSISGYALSGFLSQPDDHNDTFIHLDKSANGHYSVIMLEKC